jgi:hypothetical protein
VVSEIPIDPWSHPAEQLLAELQFQTGLSPPDDAIICAYSLDLSAIAKLDEISYYSNFTHPILRDVFFDTITEDGYLAHQATRFLHHPLCFRIMCSMSETYRSKRERWQRLRETLPAGLREHVAVRNVEAIAALPPQAQARLVEAIRSGLKRLPPAIEQLKTNPNMPVAELLMPTVQAVSRADVPFQGNLADMIQQCFPDMPRISAEALADASLMDVARILDRTHNQLLASEHLKTDFVMMVLYGLMRQTLDQLEEIIEQTPSLRQALEKSALSWKLNDWRR